MPTFALSDVLNGSIIATNVAKISGGLGRVFPTMDDGSNPIFYGAFAFAPITEIPADLFDGIHGAPAEMMFAGTFMSTQITEVPAYLFGELNGDGAMGMFSGAFTECPNLTTIEGPLFSGTLTPAVDIFSGTFENTAITEIPADLFAGIQGAPAEYMFGGTFAKCTQLQSIPENLFAGISGPAAGWMFYETFTDCTSLTGPSARINGQYLYEIWSGTTVGLFAYENATGLSDYDQIPSNWK